jgi:hypothetical protein
MDRRRQRSQPAPRFEPRASDSWTGQSPGSRKAAWEAARQARMKQATAPVRKDFQRLLLILCLPIIIAIAVTVLLGSK